MSGVTQILGDILVGMFIVAIVLALVGVILGMIAAAILGQWIIFGILMALLLLFTAWNLGRATR